MKKNAATLSTAERYHETTKYSPESIAGLSMDPLQRPPPFREYLSERMLDLKPYLKRVSGPVESPKEEERALRCLSRLLYHTGGITTIDEGEGGPHYFRAAPSAGALYPTEIFLASHGLAGLADGIHGYSVRDHGIVPLWEGDYWKELHEFTFRHPAVEHARMILIFTGLFRRSSWRYRERAYRRILLDTGHVLGNACLYAAAEGLCVVGLGGFHDAALGDLLFLDPAEEGALIVAPVLSLADAQTKCGAFSFPPPSERHAAPAAHGPTGMMQLLHEHSRIEPLEGRLREPPPREPMEEGTAAGSGGGDPALPLFSTAPGGNAGQIGAREIGPGGIGPTIRKRRSTRAFARRLMAREDFASVLGFAYSAVSPYRAAGFAPGSTGSDACPFIDPTMVATHVVVLRVRGIPPGVYRLDPIGSHLVPRRQGNFERELWNLCLGQELGRDAAAAVIHVADLPACVQRYGDRAYRYLHLDAGHIGQRLNLAAVSRGVGASGIGGFFDAEVNTLLDLPPQVSTLYITVLGTPATTESAK